jgi:hypothetical protein
MKSYKSWDLVNLVLFLLGLFLENYIVFVNFLIDLFSLLLLLIYLVFIDLVCLLLDYFSFVFFLVRTLKNLLP